MAIQTSLDGLPFFGFLPLPPNADAKGRVSKGFRMQTSKPKMAPDKGRKPGPWPVVWPCFFLDVGGCLVGNPCQTDRI